MLSQDVRGAGRVRLAEGARRIPFLLYALLLVLVAYAPLMPARMVGEDWPVLCEALGLTPAQLQDSVEAAEGHPLPVAVAGERTALAHASLGILAKMLAPGQGWTNAEVWRLRAVHLLLLLVAGLGVASFVRRGLQPWTGSEQARAAGRAAAMLFSLHPLVVPSVARLASHGDLLALACATWAVATFLRARQEQESTALLWPLALTFLASATSQRSWFLPVALAGLEYSSARRHRTRLLRFRTALTTLVVFAALFPLERGLSSLLPQVSGYPVAATSSLQHNSLAVLANATAERLGALLLPVNPQGMAAPLGYTLAAGILILALQPAFVAARSAPRLWGRLLLGWLLCVLLYQLPDAAERIQPTQLAAAASMLVPALLAAVGFGIASTALSGFRRVLIPALLALPLAALARANARPWVEAGERVQHLRSELLNASLAHPGARLLLLDLPREVLGLPAFAPALATFLEPSLAEREFAQRRAAAPPIRSIDLEGFFVLLRQPEFASERERGLVVVLPASLLGNTSGPEYIWVRLPAPTPGDGRVFWRKEGTAPAGVALDPILSRTARVKSTPGTEPGREPILRWLARSARFSGGEHRGTWIEGEDAPIACFDLSRDLTWLLGERINNIWFPGALLSITSAEITSEVAVTQVPPPQVDPHGAWLFDLSAWQRPQALGGEGYWVLHLLDWNSWQHLELGALPRADQQVYVPEAEEAQAALLRQAGGTCVWSLEWRVGGVTLATMTGRRSAAPLVIPRD